MALSVGTVVALLLSLVAWGGAATTAYASTATVTNWGDLQTAFASSGTVTLGADITAPSGSNLVMTAGSAVTLDLDGHTLSITAPPSGEAAVQDTTAALTIEDSTGTGVLTATGSSDGNSGAGIGGSPGNGTGSAGDGGTLTITGGTVNATGGFNGAGIGGGGFDSDSGSVTITGGNVNATGGYYGAGIGGGSNGPGATVTISGGTVNAGANGGAGIGSGSQNCGATTSAGVVTITGGTVNASASRAAGIGGGVCGDGGDVTIGSGGVVTAYGGPTAIGLGGAGNTVFGSLSNSGNLTLNGDLRLGGQEVVPTTVTASNGGFVNNVGGIINLNNTLEGGGTMVNNGIMLIDSGGAVANDGTTVTEHNYAVTYSMNGVSGSAPPPQSVYAASFSDDQVTLPAPPTGYVWSDSPTGGTTVTGVTDLSSLFGQSSAGATAVTLYLTGVPETVTFNPENGQASTTETVPYGTDATQPADPARASFVFNGWYTAATGGSPYDFTSPVTSSFTLYAQWALATVPVTVSGSQTYGGIPNFTATPAGLLPSGVSLSGMALCSTVNSGVTISPTLSAGGTYTVDGASCSGLSLLGNNATDYLLSLTGGSFVVNPATVPVTMSGSQTYGGSPNFTATPAGLLPSGVSLSGTATCSTVNSGVAISPTLSAGGTYAVDGASCSGLSLVGNNAANYLLSLTGGSFVVHSATVSVAVSGSQTYGGTPNFTTSQTLPAGITLAGSVACTTVNGGTPISATLSAGGSYTVDATSCSGLSLVGANAADYATSFTGGTFTVTKATPMISWATPASVVYGTALSASQLDASVTGTVGENTVTAAGTFAYSPDAGTVLHAGPHTLSTTFMPDDTVDYNTATATVALTVTPAPLTVTANDASRPFGAPNPAFSASYEGLVNNDSPASLAGTLTFNTKATAASPPGTYSIVASRLSSPDYTITYLDGTLTVTKAATTTALAVSPATPTLGGLVTFTATVAAAQANGSGTNPTGMVAFYVDGATTAAATVHLAADGTAAFQATLPGGTTAVSAVYRGDPNFLGSSTATPATATIACAQTITGSHIGAVIAAKGLTCIVNAKLSGAVIVDAGASLDVENSTLGGAIVANGAQSIRICGDTTASTGSVTVSGATGFVVVGDPGEDGCATNVVGGALNLLNNTGGLVAVDNTVTGALNASGNRGAGPFPDQTAPEVTGNHH